MRGFILTTVAVLLAIAIGVAGFDRAGLPPLIPLASNGNGYLLTGAGGVFWITVRGSGTDLTVIFIDSMNTGKCGGDNAYPSDPCTESYVTPATRPDNSFVTADSDAGAATTFLIEPNALVALTPGAVPPSLTFVRATPTQHLRALTLYHAVLAALRYCLPKGAPANYRKSARTVLECHNRLDGALKALSRAPGYSN